MKLPSLLPLLLFYIAIPPHWADAAVSQQINKGFSANPDPASSSAFQPLLADPTGSYSLGFLRVDSSGFDLAVLHLPSSLPLWRATPARPATWAGSSLSFNGSLVLSDSEAGVLWSTPAEGGGDRLVLLNSSNLQIQKLAEPVSVLWQSFDLPSDTLVLGQNLTSAAALFSTNQRFSMRLGSYSLGLQMEFGGGGPAPMYWKRTPLEAKAQIVAGGGPIYARVDQVGFLGMYQTEKAPVDVLAFDSFNRGILGLRRLTLESDGNLRAYYWNGSIWVLDFQAIADGCGLPSACGPYGLCRTVGPRCGCLDNRTEGCFTGYSGDLCGGEGDYWVLRRKGVDLANKELLAFQKLDSLEECEGSCERNCSCWGAVYNNASGFCYRMDYPVQTMLAVGNEGRVGYFKVRKGGGGGGGREEGDAGRRTETALLVVGAVVFAGGAGFGAYSIWNRRKRRAGVDGPTVDGLSAGPYKGLTSTSSFQSIELSNSFRK